MEFEDEKTSSSLLCQNRIQYSISPPMSSDGLIPSSTACFSPFVCRENKKLMSPGLYRFLWATNADFILNV